MAVIKAEGQTKHYDFDVYGHQKVMISGDKNVEIIWCKDVGFWFALKDSIENKRGRIGNYNPPANSMLQAHATLLQFFDESDIIVEGDIGEIPFSDEPGIIY